MGGGRQGRGEAGEGKAASLTLCGNELQTMGDSCDRFGGEAGSPLHLSWTSTLRGGWSFLLGQSIGRAPPRRERARRANPPAAQPGPAHSTRRARSRAERRQRLFQQAREEHRGGRRSEQGSDIRVTGGRRRDMRLTGREDTRLKAEKF